jgi:hypothetical protein
LKGTTDDARVCAAARAAAARRRARNRTEHR